MRQALLRCQDVFFIWYGKVDDCKQCKPCYEKEHRGSKRKLAPTELEVEDVGDVLCEIVEIYAARFAAAAL